MHLVSSRRTVTALTIAATVCLSSPALCEGATLPERYWGKTLIITGSGDFCTSVQAFSYPIPEGLPPRSCKPFSRTLHLKLLKTRIVEQVINGRFDGDIKMQSDRELSRGTGSAFILNRLIDVRTDKDAEAFSSFYDAWKATSNSTRVFDGLSHSAYFDNGEFGLSVLVSFRDRTSDGRWFRSNMSHHLTVFLSDDSCQWSKGTDYASGYKDGDRTMTTTRYIYKQAVCRVAGP